MFRRNPATRFVVENEIFSVKIAIFIAEMDSALSITLGAPTLCNSNHWKLPLNNFRRILARKLAGIQVQMIQSLAYCTPYL